MRRAVVALAIVAVLGGGFWIWASGLGGEQQFRYGVSNDSRQSVIVRFGSYGHFLAPPGASGRGADSFGLLHQDIEILDEQCRLLETVEVTTQSGVLWIQNDVPAKLNDVDWDDLPSNRLEHSDKCDA
jgi:hypothetical protein